MMNCLAITLNPAVDHTYVVSGFEIGGANRTQQVHRMPGGKGNNVARILRSQQHEVTATGFLGGHTGEFINAGLTAAGISTRFVWLDGKASRSCHTILDQETGMATEVLESGPEVGIREQEEFLQVLPDLVHDADVVVISGSAPTGIQAEFLERLAYLVRERTDRMVVDSSGTTLLSLLEGKPDLIKPNRDEIGALIGGDTTESAQIDFALNELIARHLAPNGRVLISRGREGAVLVSEDNIHRARPPSIQSTNTVGCGDALLAGFVDAWLTGADPPETLRQAIAFGTAAALQPVAGVVQQDDIERLILGVELKEDMSSHRRQGKSHEFS